MELSGRYGTWSFTASYHYTWILSSLNFIVTVMSWKLCRSYTKTSERTYPTSENTTHNRYSTCNHSSADGSYIPNYQTYME